MEDSNSSARFCWVTYETVIAVRWPGLTSRVPKVQFGTYLVINKQAFASLPIYWKAPFSPLHVSTDLGLMVEWKTERFASSAGENVCLAALDYRVFNRQWNVHIHNGVPSWGAGLWFCSRRIGERTVLRSNLRRRCKRKIALSIRMMRKLSLRKKGVRAAVFLLATKSSRCRFKVSDIRTHNVHNRKTEADSQRVRQRREVSSKINQSRARRQMPRARMLIGRGNKHSLLSGQ